MFFFSTLQSFPIARSGILNQRFGQTLQLFIIISKIKLVVKSDEIGVHIEDVDGQGGGRGWLYLWAVGVEGGGLAPKAMSVPFQLCQCIGASIFLPPIWTTFFERQKR